MASLPRAATTTGSGSTDNSDMPPSSEERSERPALARGKSFRRASSATPGRAAGYGRLSSVNDNAGAPTQRAALPRAGTFRAVTSGPPTEDQQPLQLRTSRASLPRGHTFRAPRSPAVVSDAELATARGPQASGGLSNSGSKKPAVPRRSLPRAGTFAYGGALRTAKSVEEEQQEARARAKAANDADIFKRVPSDLTADAKAVCGMCGNCGGGGSKSMPPWAPERLERMSPSERESVMRKFRAKEELGRLDRELRDKQHKDRMQQEERENEEIRKRAEAQMKEAELNAAAGLAGKLEKLEPDEEVDALEAAVARVEAALVDAEDTAVAADSDTTAGDGEGDNTAAGPLEEDDNSLNAKRADSVFLEDVVQTRRPIRRGQGRMSPVAPKPDDDSDALDAALNDSILSSGSMNLNVGDDGPSPQSVKRDRQYQRIEKPSLENTLALHSVDLPFENDRTSSPPSKRTQDCPSDEVCDHGEDAATCMQCDLLEQKVQDLEEQLKVLREVVELSNRNTSGADEEQESAENARKTTWRTRVMDAYFGSNKNGATSSERARLKTEVDALRKATDFLFAKLQEADQRSHNTH